VTPDPEALSEEGQQLFHQGDYQEALSRFQMAYEAYAEQGQQTEAAEVLNNIGVIHRMEGQLDEAADCLNRASRIFAEAGDMNRHAQTLSNLAPILSKKGSIDEAETYYKQAAEVFDELGDEDRRGQVLMALGVLLFREGKRAAGLRSYETGLGLIKNPTPAQKRTRMMLKVRQKMMGG
jgi:tetratricopeptide (TPR) repeat protein